MGKNFPIYPIKIGPQIIFKAEESLGPPFAYTISAFNRILDFSNGLDIYLGFFFCSFVTCTNYCWLYFFLLYP